MTDATAERSRQLTLLVETSGDVPGEALEEHLSSRCEDESLVAEAMSILLGESATHDLSADLGRASRPELASVGPGVAHPESVGPYRIEGMIGKGGMGVVYEAFQSEPIERRVAVKLMRSTVRQASDRARFENEQRALARMAHPNVAQMYEAGVTVGGQPYVVMELIDGEPVTTYCDRRGLTVAQRLTLFVSACRAVEHAHRRQLLHRDLKPSNILVTEADEGPVPKVIDFGIAKLLDVDTTQTISGSILGTPAYMSPESVEGVDVDTRADVYSLGVLLYELLSGAKPFSGPGVQAAEVLRRAREEAPTRPSKLVAGHPRAEALAASRGTTPKELEAALANDLDWIVLRAMARERSARYVSVSALVDDVLRYLEVRPVAARPWSLGYRLGKLARRHRAVAAALAVAMLAAVVAVAFAVRYTIDVARERRGAEMARQQAEHLVTFLLDDLYTELEPVARRDFLERVASEATRYFASLPEPLRASSSVRHARALRNLGRVELRAGDIAAARVAIEAAMALDRAAVEQGVGAEATEGLALDHRRMADVLERLGQRQAALAAVGQALRLRHTLLAADPASVVHREELAWDLSELGWARRDLRDLAGAIEAFRESIAIRRGLVAEATEPTQQKWLGATLKDLGSTLSTAGDLEAGQAMAREAVDLLESLVETDPGRTDFIAEAAASWAALSTAAWRLGDRSAAIEAREMALRLFRRWTDRDPSESRAWQFLADSHVELARLRRAEGAESDAVRELVLALDAIDGLGEELPVAVIRVEALLELGRGDEVRVDAGRIIAAGWHETRPRLAALLRDAGYLS